MVILVSGTLALCNDGAASSGAGGIQLRHEANISMENGGRSELNTVLIWLVAPIGTLQ